MRLIIYLSLASLITVGLAGVLFLIPSPFSNDFALIASSTGLFGLWILLLIRLKDRIFPKGKTAEVEL